MPSPRVATYLRVSTAGQDVEPQRLHLAAYCASKGWEVAQEHAETASGRQARRPALQRLLRAVRRQEVDVVLCTKVDRLARSTKHLCELAEELEAAGVDLVCADQPVDTTSATGRLLFGVLSVVATFEADLIRERTLQGLEAARRHGKRLGRPKALDAQATSRARRMARAGQPLAAIARTLGVSRGAVRTALGV